MHATDPDRTARRGLDRRTLLTASLAASLTAGLPGRAGAQSRAVEAGGLAAILAPDARVSTLYEDGRWCEGPVWVPRLGGLVFSDVARDRMLLLRPDRPAETFRSPSANANGNALDAQGRLVTCEHRNRRVVRQEADGRLTVLADRFEGRRLNSPNDVVVSGDGAVWFTDPTYGIETDEEGRRQPQEQRARHVFRLDPGGRLEAVADGFAQPNGLAFSPDGTVLYVSDSEAATVAGGRREIHAFDVIDGRRLARERVFARLESGVPDGLKLDADGRLYAGAGDGVSVWQPDGTFLGRIPTRGPCANIAFGGADGRRLFLCAGARVEAVDLRVRGAG